MGKSHFHASIYRIGVLSVLIFFSGFLIFVAVSSHYNDSHRTAITGSDIIKYRQALVEAEE